MGNEASGLVDPRLALLHNLAQLEAELRAGAAARADPREHGWDPKDCSDNMEVQDNGMTVVRKHSAATRTDCVRGKKSYRGGVHVWEITWPRDQRGSHAVVGVATELAPLTCSGYTSLVGSNDQSLGWDIARNELLFNDCVIRSYPDDTEDNNFQAPEVITVVLDMDRGTISYKGDGKNYGVALTGLKKIRHGLCPAVSAVFGGCKISIRYLGGSRGPPSALRLVDDGRLKFHQTNGDNIQLSNEDRTAQRTSAQDTPRGGIVVSSRQLKDDEKFEVTLDKAIGKHDGALKIGIVGVPFSIPSTVSKAEPQKIWYWDGAQVYHNGEVVKTLNITLDAALEGEKIGVVRKSDGSLHCLYKGRDLGTVATETPEKYHGIVDVYGSTTQVTLQVDEPRGQHIPPASRGHGESTGSEAERILDHMTTTIDMMRERNVGNIRVVKDAVVENLSKPFSDHPRYQQLMGDKLSEIGGAKVIVAYLKFLQPSSMSNEISAECYHRLLTICGNYSDGSLKFARKLVEHDILDVIIHDLDKFKSTYNGNKFQGMVVASSLVITHNCSKPTENKATFVKKNMMQYLLPLSMPNNDKEVMLDSMLTLSYIVSPSEYHLLKAQESTIVFLLQILQEALAKSDHESRGYNAYELVMGMNNLSVNDTNRNTFVDKGAGHLLGKMMKIGKDRERECAADALWSLTGNDTRGKLKQMTPTLIPILDALKKSRVESVREAAARARAKLEGDTTTGQVFTETPGRPSGVPVSRAQCPYRDLCERFKDTLKLDDAFFNTQFDICYCNDCHMARGDNLYYSRGSPPQDYGLPVSWCRFGLSLPPKVKALSADKKWHRAYHGTKKDSVAKMLESGDILMPGDVALGGLKIKEREGHFCDDYKPEGFDTRKIFLSPSIRYAGHDAYATPNKFVDTKTNKTYNARVAFQVFVRPGSYEAGDETIGATGQIDPKFSNQEIEWSTKERGSCILYGLLLKVS